MSFTRERARTMGPWSTEDSSQERRRRGRCPPKRSTHDLARGSVKRGERVTFALKGDGGGLRESETDLVGSSSCLPFSRLAMRLLMKFIVQHFANAIMTASPHSSSSRSAFSRLELTMVLRCLELLLAVALPVFANIGPRSERIACLNLRQIGRAFNVWASEHGGSNPWLLSVPEGGTWGDPRANNVGFSTTG